MKKNGFTLIELLAVILILGIIALIAIPTISTIITDSKKGAFKSSVNNIVLATEQTCQTEQLKGEPITNLYVFSETGVYPKLDVKGKLPISGSIAMNDNCEAVASLTNGDVTVTKNLISEEVTVVDGNSANKNLVAPLNNLTKKNIYFYSALDNAVDNYSEQVKQEFIEDGIQDFMATANGIGSNFMVDSDDKVLGYFGIITFPNTYTYDLAKENAIKAIKSLLKGSSEENETSLNELGIYYYITEDTIYIMEGTKKISDTTYKAEVESSYAYIKNNYTTYGMERFEIEY